MVNGSRTGRTGGGRLQTLVALSAIVICWVGACGGGVNDDTTATGVSCTSTTQCAAGETCQAGRCVTSAIEDAATDRSGCTGDSQCAVGETCRAGRCVRVQGGEAAPDTTGCTTDRECAAGETCGAGRCIPTEVPDAAGVQDASGIQDATVAPDGPCSGAVCGNATPCCPGSECKSVALYQCIRATRDPNFCRNNTEWDGRCYAKDEVPCERGFICPNIPIFGPAPAGATCCAPLGNTGVSTCVEPASNPAFCASDGGAVADGGNDR